MQVVTSAEAMWNEDTRFTITRTLGTYTGKSLYKAM